MPSPNGFHDFIRAGQGIQETTSDIKSLTDRGALREFVTANTEALRLISNGLHHESRVFIDHSISFQAGINGNLLQVAAFQKLVPALLAEGRLAELEHRPEEALTNYLDALRVSHEAVRGGVMLHRIAGFSMEQLAVGAVRTFVTNGAAAQCRQAALALEEIESRREPMEETIARERNWAFQTGDWRQKLMLRFFQRTLRRNEQQLAKQFQTRQLKARELMIAWAARSYELEQGKSPTTAADLVPAFLKSIPRDPMTGRELPLTPTR